MVRVGPLDAPDPVRVLRARAKEGPVAAEVDPDVSITALCAFVGQASSAAVAELDLRCAGSGVRVRLGPRPQPPPSPRVDPTPAGGELSRSAGDVHVVARPAKLELVVRIRADSDPDEKLHAVVSECAAVIREPSLTVVVTAPKGSAWGRIAPLMAIVNAAVGERVARHELLQE
jgi:hypothetical protein